MKHALALFFSCALIYSCQNAPKDSGVDVENKTTPTNTLKMETPTPNTNPVASADNKTSDSIDTTKLQGIDISEYQINIDWAKVLEDHISFVFIKATGGETYEDPSFETHWNDSKKAGITRGAYHFYYTRDDPVQQAKFFISKVLPLSSKSDLPPVIDIETHGVNTNISIDQLQKDIQTYLAVIEKAFDRKPILYTSHNFAQKYFDNADFDAYYLWLADYNTAPNVPNGWKSTGWTFWQNSPSAKVSGIENQVDHDFFKGTMAELKAL